MDMAKNKEEDIVKQKSKAKKKFFMFFATIADVGSLVVALIYVSFVVLSMIVKFGEPWLNWTMFGITVAYIVFFLFKISYLNKTMQSAGRMKRIVKLSNKYTKLAMRIINAVFVTLSLIATQHGQDNTFAMLGVMVVGLTFVITIMWDIGNFIVRRKIQDFTASWRSLSTEEKAERIELLLSGFIRSINNAAILDDYFDVGLNIKRMVATKMGDRVRISDARRATPKNEIEYTGDESSDEEVKGEAKE